MATIVIKVNDVDLTDIIIFSDARFDSRVNGEPGSCEFRVRDDNNDLVFEAGQSITVDINSERVWAGYLMQATSTYIFPAGPLPPDVPRIWRITGVDINILFRRRIAVDPDDPTVMTGKTYKYTGIRTTDNSAIVVLLFDFLDISGDNLGYGLIENVGDINVDQDVNAFAASWTFEQAMTSIASLPAAIFYIDPDRNIVYTDVDTVSAPFGLSDQPDGVTTFGYREPELLKDASNLINEYFAWGAGTGSNEPVFSRLEDTDSVDLHGRWQQASLTYDVYTQATVDRIADSWVNGSPQSRRGHKDDKIAFMCTVFEPGLRAGMKVDVTSNVFAFNDVIPIRELRLSFATQTDPVYRLTLSHAIDAPWSFYQMFNPSIPRLAWDDQFVFIGPPSCSWHWQNGTGDGTFGSGRWSISPDCLLSLDVEGDSVTDDFVLFELDDDQTVAYEAIRAGASVSMQVTVPFLPTNPNPPSLDECGGSISLFVEDAAHTITGRIDVALRLFNDPGSGGNGLVDLTAFGKTRQTFFTATSGTYTVTLTLTSTTFTGTVNGTHVATMSSTDTPPSVAPPEIDMDSLDLLRIRIGTNDLSIPGIFTARPSVRDYGDGVGKTNGTDTFDLGSPFWIRTSRVWLDGEAQELDVDYAEDPDAGLIIFTPTPAANLDVVVTRVIRTPLGGGASRRVI